MNNEFKKQLEDLLVEVESELSCYCTCKVCLEGENDVRALELISQARKTDAWCCIKIRSDYSYIWVVDIVRSEVLDMTTEGVVNLVNAGGIYKTFNNRLEHGTVSRASNESLLLATLYALKAAILKELA